MKTNTRYDNAINPLTELMAIAISFQALVELSLTNTPFDEFKGIFNANHNLISQSTTNLQIAEICNLLLIDDFEFDEIIKIYDTQKNDWKTPLEKAIQNYKNQDTLSEDDKQEIEELLGKLDEISNTLLPSISHHLMPSMIAYVTASNTTSPKRLKLDADDFPFSITERVTEFSEEQEIAAAIEASLKSENKGSKENFPHFFKLESSHHPSSSSITPEEKLQDYLAIKTQPQIIEYDNVVLISFTSEQHAQIFLEKSDELGFNKSKDIKSDTSHPEVSHNFSVKLNKGEYTQLTQNLENNSQQRLDF